MMSNETKWKWRSASPGTTVADKEKCINLRAKVNKLTNEVARLKANIAGESRRADRAEAFNSKLLCEKTEYESKIKRLRNQFSVMCLVLILDGKFMLFILKKKTIFGLDFLMLCIQWVYYLDNGHIYHKDFVG